jgi:hypothetical protein
MRGAGSAGGSTTSGAGCFSNSQNHSPAEPNPLRTDRIPTDLFCPFEQLRICDGLSATEQAYYSGRRLKHRDKYRTLAESLL